MLSRNIEVAKSDIAFTVTSDLHAEKQPQVTEAILRSMQCDQAAFATVLGDFTSEGSRASYERHLLPILNRYRPKNLLACCGNHDQIPAWQSVFGPNVWYNLHLGDCSFFWLYNARENGLEEDTQQWDWLRRELPKARRHRFVFAHCPPNGVVRWAYHAFRSARTHELLAENKVAAFFAGHIHTFDQEVVDGVRYYVCGGGGGPGYNVRGMAVRSCHYLHVAVNGDNIKTWRVKTSNGIFYDELLLDENRA
jgi:predicted phosphodiesterase